ncbi:hypothetical protein [Pseudotabrizicola algicola]|uniref:5-carboxymethyl-2-hydroxymuconate isomerase n=1 Tax=Pseudotabrizicola algicola TaxID=2709381 RepID=A0A6B3RKS7_9RHOB|nr:hypothetical protein [Pseudotabrizicola algicola]NEX46644.1 hypothetical protein [Pseudotabrizicola algicola]
MPNVKLYIDQSQYGAVGPQVEALLPDLREMLCTALSVGHAACQIAVIPVAGLHDQPQINAELHVLPRAERTPALLRQMALDLRTRLNAATGLEVAVRIASLDPETYITLK